MKDNKKGQLNISMVILVAVGLIVGLVILQAASQYVGSTNEQTSYVNASYTTPALNAYTDIEGCQEVIGSYIIINSTSNTSVSTGNTTLVERVGDDGLKTVSIYQTAAPYASKPVKITFTCAEDGYIDDGGARSVASVIVIFCAVAIVIFALIPSVRNSILERFDI